jgi:hypothetical protein
MHEDKTLTTPRSGEGAAAELAGGVFRIRCQRVLTMRPSAKCAYGKPFTSHSPHVNDSRLRTKGACQSGSGSGTFIRYRRVGAVPA